MVYALRKINPHKNFKVYVESIAADSEMEFDISIDLEFLIKAKNELNKTNSQFGRQNFIGIEQKLNELFDIDIINDEDFKEEEIVTNIIKAWIDYGNEVSQLEKKWLDTINNAGTANLNSLKKLYSEQNKVKIGFGSGFSGMTMLPLFLKDDQLKSKLLEFYKLVGIGFHKSTKATLNINDFPFTRKYLKNNVVYDGFGWVKIIQNGDDKIDTIKSGEREIPAGAKAEKLEIKRPPNSILAEIIDVNSKPPKIKILEGEYEGSITILPGVRLEGLKLGLNSKVFVKLSFQKDKIQSASFVSKVE